MPNRALPQPRLFIPNVDECPLQDSQLPRSSPGASLDELLELAARFQSARFGTGTLVGECLDTHNPHLPHRVLVRARDEDGKPVIAWLPVLANIRIDAGCKVLLSKPENWPEPVVIGSIGGLERPEAEVQEIMEPVENDPVLQLEQGQTLVITDSAGQPLLQLQATVDGPRISLLQSDVSIETKGCLRLGADRIELRAGDGGVDIRTEGETVVRGRVIRLN